MSRSRSPLIAIVLMTGIAIAYWQYAQYVILALVLLLMLKFLSAIYKVIRSIATHFVFKDVDTMEGLDFELHVADLLRSRGYSSVTLTEQYDYGIDIIADKDGIRWGIQAKRHSGLVKAEAVRQVVTALKVYRCDRAMVITNSTFSKVAKRLADCNDCILIDRSKLNEMTH